MAAAAPAAGAPGSRGRGRDGTRRRELSRPRGTAADLQPPARPVVTGGGCRSPPWGGVFRRRWRSEFLTTGAVRVRGGVAGTGGQGGAGVRGVRAPRGAESERSVPAGRGSGARKVLGEAPGGRFLKISSEIRELWPEAKHCTRVARLYVSWEWC
ncbi:uncharacterized PE-PGRS family protein PE_PGRS20-like [Rissa tridactyla]|uniref:uncharacterized PE-PGRS family protein PE_PGRS20-like n=1 Tax=Rissa tridactyla TaxID=75485 RepID=UPI0023BA6E1D|nr:uncharacterized PE-PGRS family protein PE_PGRS20-like [Rissa tridactyla]